MKVLAILILSVSASHADKFGNIRGTVKYAQKHQRQPLARNTDPVCAKVKRLAEDIVTDDKGHLRDVHVRLAANSKLPAPSGKALRKRAVINQSQCMYEPRVTGILAPQPVAIRNVDPTFHNVHAKKDGKTKWNTSQPKGAPDIVKHHVGKAGDVISLGCDVHPWMRAFIVVWHHSFFDVTQDAGNFSIKRVPVGKYTLEAWHPTLGLLKKDVTVTPGDNEVSFTFGKTKP